MLCLTDYNKPYALDNPNQILPFRNFWVFDTKILDFKLTEIDDYFAENIGPAYKIRVNNTEMWLPAHWDILTCDKELSIIDSVGIAVCSAQKHYAFLFSLTEQKILIEEIQVLEYSKEESITYINSKKHHCLVVPVGSKYSRLKKEYYDVSIVVNPTDFGKNIKNKTVGDILF